MVETTRCVALLRGINVGGNNKVDMKALAGLFQRLGFGNVSTYINSGNVLFDTPKTDRSKLGQRIERELKKAFGLEIPVVIRDRGNMMKLARAIPAAWTNDPRQKTDVLFLWEEYDSKKSLGLIKQTPGVDTLIYVPGAIAWNVPRKHYSKSGMSKFIGTLLYKHMTARNVNTVRKLAALMK